MAKIASKKTNRPKSVCSSSLEAIKVIENVLKAKSRRLKIAKKDLFLLPYVSDDNNSCFVNIHSSNQLYNLDNIKIVILRISQKVFSN